MAELNGDGGNVPFQTTPRYNIVGINPTKIIHKMAAGASLDGFRAALDVPSTQLADPVVTAGKAEFSVLQHGGLMFLGGNNGRPAIVEAWYTKECAAVVMRIVAMDDPNIDTVSPLTAIRPLPTVPFRLGSNECLQVVAAPLNAGSFAAVEVIVRLDAQRIL